MDEDASDLTLKQLFQAISCINLLKNKIHGNHRSRKGGFFSIILFVSCIFLLPAFHAYAATNSYTVNYLIPKPKKFDDKLLVQLKPVLAYLHDCNEAKIDWTTSLPISSPTQKIRLESAEACLRDNMHTYYNSEINEYILDAIVQYFAKKSIKCSKENIKIRYSSFDVIRDLYTALQIDKDDVVLIVAPTYGYYIYQAAEHNIKTQLVFSQKKNGWKITPKELEQALRSSKAKLLIFTNPVNPTGVFYSKKEVEELAEVIKKFNVYTISDEIFSDISFDSDVKPYSLAAVEGMSERTLTLSGLGKARGIRLSFACCNLNYISALPVSGILKPIQAGAVEALKNNEANENYLTQTMNNYRSTIDFILEQLKNMNDELNKYYNTKDIIYVNPYIIPKATNIFLISFPGMFGKKIAKRTINNSLDLAKHIYQTAHVATVPGEGFFINGNEMVLRIPMSVSKEELQKGFDGILNALKF